MIAKRQASTPIRLIPLSAIKRFARRIAEQFQPEKIILFGSYAYGEPNADSDVDLLVVMPARNQIDQAIKIRRALKAAFPMDLIVRTPKKLNERLDRGVLFTTHIVSNGKVLYEALDRGMGPKSGRRPRHRQKNLARKKTSA